MSFKAKLEETVGKAIDEICPNEFHDRRSNHCAHYVSHVLDLRFSYNCVEYKGGKNAPGNVRVHETFARCPLVGRFENADLSKVILVFVTRGSNVDLSRKWMGNIPQKHIGIFCDGYIYHYSNSKNAVTKWTPGRFLSAFQEYYTGNQELFFGTIPGSDIELDVDPSGVRVGQGVAFELRSEGRNWLARARNSQVNNEFFVGSEVNQPSAGYFGIHQSPGKRHGHQFRAAEYFEAIDQWAVLLEVTGHCESQNYFNVVNTYDRAKFTFGFYQFAAHTPKDNLALLFRELLRLPLSRDYFPELELIEGRIHRVKEDGGTTDLETPFGGNLQFFMNYLNPSRRLIDEQEILNAARLMHWAENDPECRQAQVSVAATILQEKMSSRYQGWYDLDGASDTTCAIIADIHHQGRASKETVAKALQEPDPLGALLTVNDKNYSRRNLRLSKKVAELEQRGSLGSTRYDAAANEFIRLD